MNTFFTHPIGRLRLFGLLEGTSLVLLVGVAVPLKYLAGNPAGVKIIGPIHGALFVLYVFQTMSVSIEQRWSFRTLTWKVLLACLLPFGTFYIDRKILKTLQRQ